MRRALHSIFLTIWLIFCGAASVFAQTSSAPEQFFEIQLQIQQGNTILGSPVIISKAADEAFVSVNKPGGYAVRLMIAPDATRPAPAGAKRLAMQAQIFINESGAWKKISSPQLSFLAGERASVTSPAPSARGAALLHFSVVAKEVVARKLTKVPNPVKSCSLWQELATEPLAGAQIPDFTYVAGGDRCCSTGCLTCCGNSACCSDTTNGEGGCCTGITKQL